MPHLHPATHHEWLSRLPKDVLVQRCLEVELALQAVRKDQARALDILDTIRRALDPTDHAARTEG